MIRTESYKSYADRSKKLFQKFLETYSLEYVSKGNLIEFEKGSRYIVIFGDSDILLYDDKMTILLKDSVFEIMQHLSGTVDILV